MKKNFIVFITIMTLVCGIVVLFSSCGSDKTTASENESGLINAGSEIMEHEQILAVSSFSEFNNLVKSLENEHSVASDNSGATINDFELFGYDASITYFFDKSGNVAEYDIFLSINTNTEDETGVITQELTADILGERVSTALSDFCAMFNNYSAPDLAQVTNSDGTYTKLKTNEAYESMLNGTSNLVFTVMDQEGSFWQFVEYCEDGYCWIEISRSFDTETYIDYFANISLYNIEKESET